MAEERREVADVAEMDQMEGQERPAKKGKFKLILIIVFVLIIAGGAGGYFVFGKKVMAKYLGNKADAAQAAPVKKEVVGPILQLDPFVFNLTGNQSRYAKVTLGIEVKDVKAMEDAKKMIPVIRDRILSIFGTKAAEVLMDVDQRETIKKEVHASLKTIFPGEDGLKAVYITDIIIQ
jgi:flagellar FliL protein